MFLSNLLQNQFTEYELSIASNLVDPESIPCSWSDIAGLDDVLQELKDTVIFPLVNRGLFGNSQLLQPPKGITFHIFFLHSPLNDAIQVCCFTDHQDVAKL